MESDEKSIAIIDDVAPATTEVDSQGSDFAFISMFPNIRHPKQRAFLSAYSLTGSIAEASQAAQCTRDIHYVWLQRDSEYAEAFDQADVYFGDVLEATARKRALEKSDLLMIFTLKAQKPWKYRDNVDITSGGKPLEPQRIEVVYEVKQGANDT